MRLRSEADFKPGVVEKLSTCLTVPSPFYLGHGIQEQFADVLAEHKFDKLFLFSDGGVMTSHGQTFHQQLEARFGQVDLTLLPEGESAKSFNLLEETLEDLMAKGVTKNSILLSFGGGSVGNLTGLCAGLTFRGIRFVEIPTTMVGQTDSTLSNKQAINGRTGKNHFGLYHAPVFIWADSQYLLSEPLRMRRSGLVEGVKNGFISNPEFLDYLRGVLRPALDYKAPELHTLVANIVLSKLEILKADPTEKKLGITLEYGHTFGHAIEWLAKMNHESLTHGEAVALGMKLAAELGADLGLLKERDVELHYLFLDELLRAVPRIPNCVTRERLPAAMTVDNKRTGRTSRFVLLERIGRCYNPEGDYLVTVEPARVEQVISKVVGREFALARAS